MADSHARRDKALESIAGSLGDIVGLLKKVEKNTRRTQFRNYPDDQRPDPFAVPEVSEPAVTGKDEPGGPNGTHPFVESSHPYFRRSPNADDTERGPEIDGTNAVV